MALPSGPGAAARPIDISGIADPRARYALVVSLVYNMFNGGNAPLEPAPDLGLSGYTIHDYVIMSDFTPWGRKIEAFYGFLASKDDGSETIVAMRGTVGNVEAYDDADFFLSPFVVKNARIGNVHDGFLSIYHTLEIRDPKTPKDPKSKIRESFADQVHGSIQAFRKNRKLERAAPAMMIAAGHSLGAALLTLYVAENAVNYSDNLSVFTYGSPRVGDGSFAHYYDTLANITTQRIHIKADKIPNVPPDAIYSHVNGLGVEIVDHGVRDTTACHHAISTYMATLDPGYSVGQECQV